jgi:prolyl-tRNA synthetase
VFRIAGAVLARIGRCRLGRADRAFTRTEGTPLVPPAQSAKAATAISPTRAEDFAGWYQEVVREVELATMAHVRGCMVIRPWGYRMWELMQAELDLQIRARRHANVYFPLFIPVSYIQAEATHVEGFAKEMAVVTHHRLESVDGVLVPAGPLEEPVVVRPTSETIFGKSMAEWIQSYRDLPMRLNQWCNVVRWEMRPRVFLRTTEFLWQEGHTAHESEASALADTLNAHEMYRTFAEDFLCIPTVPGEKPESERFPGAVQTFTIEAMMQDGRALQAGTSHYLGQNFARAADIRFLDRDNQRQHVYTTSFGISTRLIGAVIMTHGDDDGLVLPPKIAPAQVVIVPILRGEGGEDILAYAEEVATAVARPGGLDPIAPDRVLVDRTERRANDVRWSYIKKGAPVIIEVGPRDAASRTVSYRVRLDHRNVRSVPFAGAAEAMTSALAEVHEGLLTQARTRLRDGIRTDLTSFEDLRKFFEESRGLVLAPWCGDPECEAALKPLAVSIRCIPEHLEAPGDVCIVDGRPRRFSALFGQSY